MKNSTKKFFLLCPVPNDQKPINEYIALKENTFFHSFIFFFRQSQKFSFIFSCLFFSFFYFSFFQKQIVFLNFFSLVFLSTFLLLSISLFILFRWIQLQRNFQSSRFFYEEASWYDGQFWEKDISLIKNDQLIINQKIKPILKEIKQVFFQFFLFNLIVFTLMN